MNILAGCGGHKCSVIARIHQTSRPLQDQTYSQANDFPEYCSVFIALLQKMSAQEMSGENTRN